MSKTASEILTTSGKKWRPSLALALQSASTLAGDKDDPTAARAAGTSPTRARASPATRRPNAKRRRLGRRSESQPFYLHFFCFLALAALRFDADACGVSINVADDERFVARGRNRSRVLVINRVVWRRRANARELQRAAKWPARGGGVAAARRLEVDPNERPPTRRSKPTWRTS